jgi:hypothetical protein
MPIPKGGGKDGRRTLRSAARPSVLAPGSALRSVPLDATRGFAALERVSVCVASRVPTVALSSLTARRQAGARADDFSIAAASIRQPPVPEPVDGRLVAVRVPLRTPKKRVRPTGGRLSLPREPFDKRKRQLLTPPPHQCPQYSNCPLRLQNRIQVFCRRHGCQVGGNWGFRCAWGRGLGRGGWMWPEIVAGIMACDGPVQGFQP